MTYFLAFLTLCLALFFLSVFFQLSKMERRMADQVTLLEKYIMMRYGLKQASKTPTPESSTVKTL